MRTDVLSGLHRLMKMSAALFGLLLWVGVVAAQNDLPDGQQGKDFAVFLNQLTESDFDVKEQAIHGLAKTGDARLDKLFRTLLNGDLYYQE